MPATVTATLKTTGNANLQGNAFVRFKLRNFAGFVPRVNATGVLAETTIDAFPDGSGAISQSVYQNNEISPDTTFYTIEFWDQGRITSSGNYLINGATDLDTAAQLNAPPVPPGFKLVLQNNGADNSSQQLLNLTSDDASVTITDEGNGQIDLSASSGQTTTGGTALLSGGSSVAIVNPFTGLQISVVVSYFGVTSNPGILSVVFAGDFSTFTIKSDNISDASHVNFIIQAGAPV